MNRRFVQQLIGLGADTRCTADLLRYFQRQPTAYVTTRQLASWVGYRLDAVEASIVSLTRAGRLVQRRLPKLMAVLYRLVAHEWLSEFARAASTTSWRRQLRQVMLGIGRVTALPDG